MANSFIPIEKWNLIKLQHEAGWSFARLQVEHNIKASVIKEFIIKVKKNLEILKLKRKSKPNRQTIWTYFLYLPKNGPKSYNKPVKCIKCGKRFPFASAKNIVDSHAHHQWHVKYQNSRKEI